METQENFPKSSSISAWWYNVTSSVIHLFHFLVSFYVEQTKTNSLKRLEIRFLKCPGTTKARTQIASQTFYSSHRLSNRWKSKAKVISFICNYCCGSFRKLYDISLEYERRQRERPSVVKSITHSNKGTRIRRPECWLDAILAFGDGCSCGVWCLARHVQLEIFLGAASGAWEVSQSSVGSFEWFRSKHSSKFSTECFTTTTRMLISSSLSSFTFCFSRETRYNWYKLTRVVCKVSDLTKIQDIWTKKILLMASPFFCNCLFVSHQDEVPEIRLVVHSRVRFRLATKNCSMRVLRTGGTIDKFLEQSFQVFLYQREEFCYYDDGDSEITR